MSCPYEGAEVRRVACPLKGGNTLHTWHLLLQFLESQNVCPLAPLPPAPDSSLPGPGSAPVPSFSPQPCSHPHPAGVDTMASYEEALRFLRYRNWHSRSLLDRKFKLVCSELNGRYVSNEFQVEVSVGLPWRKAPCLALALANAEVLSVSSGNDLGLSQGVALSDWGCCWSDPHRVGSQVMRGG